MKSSSIIWKTEGYEVDTANSAEEAMQMQITDYSLLLLDIMMGEMSGFQMARRLKERPETAHIPIIFITALDNEDSTVKGLNIGADDYIAKPISVKELKARVAAVLRRAYGNKDKEAKDEETDGETVTYKSAADKHYLKTVTLDERRLPLQKLELETAVAFPAKAQQGVCT